MVFKNNYFYELPDDIIKKILDRKDKLDKIDKLKKQIKWEEKEIERLVDEATDLYPVQECEFIDLYNLREQLDILQFEIYEEDVLANL